MATRLPYGAIDTGQVTDPFMAGGSFFLPPTAQPTSPQRISPQTFATSPSGRTAYTPTPTFDVPQDFPGVASMPITPMPAVPVGGTHNPSLTGTPEQGPSLAAVDAEYMADLGRHLEPGDYEQYWMGDTDPNWATTIKNSPEALGRRSSTATPTAPQRNVIQIGGDPQSQLIDAGLADLIKRGGATDSTSGLMKQLQDIISKGGITRDSEMDLNRARDEEARAFTGQTEDARSALASRGVASTPGVAQGGEISAIKRITESLAPTYADTVAGIETHAADTKNSTLLSSLQMATGLSAQESNNLLGALGGGTQRQTALSQIALQSLEQDDQWNEFVANYGLNKDQVAAQIKNGNIQSLIPLLTAFLQSASQGAQGFIGK